MALLDELRSIVVNLNETSKYISVLDQDPTHRKSISEASSKLKDAQVSIAKLTNKIESLKQKSNEKTPH